MRNVIVTLFLTFLAVLPSQNSHAQILETVPFSVKANAELKKKMYDVLENDIQEMKDLIGSSPWLAFAFVDLNYDGKDEIFVNVQDEYILVDEHGNSYVHGFAQTSKGLIKIFKSPAAEIKLEPSYGDGLKKIHVYKRPDLKTPTIFVWDGEKEYIEESEKK